MHAHTLHPRATPKRPPRQEPPLRVVRVRFPSGAERQYRRMALARVEALHRATLAGLSLRRADVGETGRILSLIGVRGRSTAPSEDDLARIAGLVDSGVLADLERLLGADPWWSRGASRADALAWVRENVGLIKSIDARYLDEVAAGIMEHSADPEAMAAFLEERYGVARSRAELIARDQVGTLHAQLQQRHCEVLGLVEFRWRTQGDNRVRPEHAAREGGFFRWDAPPGGGPPGAAIACLVGSTELTFADRSEVAYRHRYDGELTEIVAATGVALRVTPNHPVLTTRGWVPAKLIERGDHVIHAAEHQANFVEGDVKHGKPSIEQAFDTFARLGMPQRKRGTSVDFHGDGAADQDVDVVDVEWSLPADFVAAFSQGACEFILAQADDSLPMAGSLHERVVGLGPSESQAVRGFEKMLALLRSGPGQPVEHRRAAVAWLDACAAKVAVDGAPLDAEALCKRLHALASEESPHHILVVEWFRVARRAVGLHVRHPMLAERLGDVVRIAAEGCADLGEGVPLVGQAVRVLDVRRGEQFSGHVYNLQTASGWFVAAGLVVHNCRCVAEPVVRGATPAPTPRAVPGGRFR